MKCPDALPPDGGICPRCGGPRGPSGVDGGSWVHISTAPDRVVMTECRNGRWSQFLANGVIIHYKKGVDPCRIPTGMNP